MGEAVVLEQGGLDGHDDAGEENLAAGGHRVPWIVVTGSECIAGVVFTAGCWVPLSGCPGVRVRCAIELAPSIVSSVGVSAGPVVPVPPKSRNSPSFRRAGPFNMSVGVVPSGPPVKGESCGAERSLPGSTRDPLRASPTCRVPLLTDPMSAIPPTRGSVRRVLPRCGGVWGVTRQPLEAGTTGRAAGEGGPVGTSSPFFATIAHSPARQPSTVRAHHCQAAAL